MATILINGLKSKTGGGKSILNNYLGLLKKSQTADTYFVLTENTKEYEKYANKFIKLVQVKKKYNKGIFFPFLNSYILPEMIKKLNIDVVFNMADIPIPTKVTQVYLFDWPYAVYPDSVAWKRMLFKDFLVRKIKLVFFRRYLKCASIIIAQTQVICNRLEEIFHLKNVVIVPNAVSIDNLEKDQYAFPVLPSEGIKLLYLTYYYTHKNIEILIPLAKEIKRLRLNFKIITTIDQSQHKWASLFINEIKQNRLDDVIYNVGPTPMQLVPSLYKCCDALLMPTLLESFSGTYAEAMFHGLPIFTSDLCFARGVCGDAAFYFDPLNEKNILDTLMIAFSNSKILKEKISAGRRLINNAPSWKAVFEEYQKIIEGCKHKENV